MSRMRRQRGKKKDYIGIFIMVLCLLTAGTAGWYFVQTKAQANTYNELGCKVGENPDHLVILLDRSDALLPMQKSDALRRIESRFVSSGVGSRTSLWVLDPSTPELVSQVFDGCQPRNGDNANPLIENERRMRARWNREFIDPLYLSLNDALRDEPADRSPLMEAVQRIGVEAFDLERNDGAERRLLILSDLLHHTDSFSHYRDSCDYEQFRGSAYAKAVSAPLRGIEVDVLYVGRPGQERFQTNCHGLFWEQYLSDGQARLRSIHRLAGG